MLPIYIAVFFIFQSWLILIIFTAMALLAMNTQHWLRKWNQIPKHIWWCFRRQNEHWIELDVGRNTHSYDGLDWVGSLNCMVELGWIGLNLAKWSHVQLCCACINDRTRLVSVYYGRGRGVRNSCKSRFSLSRTTRSRLPLRLPERSLPRAKHTAWCNKIITN